MRPTQHKSNTRVIGAPLKHDQSQVEIVAVPVTDSTIKDRPVVTVFYDLTDEERAQIAAGGLIGVWVIGTTLPPMALTVQVDK